MSVQIKVKGGTPDSGKTLCLTCKHATIVRGQNMEEVILCDSAFYGTNGAHGSGIVPFKVAECTDYQLKTQPDKHEMEAIAWQITPRKRGQKGFQAAPAEGEKTEMEVVIQPPKKNRSMPPDE